METSLWAQLVDRLRGYEYRRGLITPETPIHRIEFDYGLTDREVWSVEERFTFRFPPDLRAFLQTALPKAEGFPDWRSGDESRLREWLDAPRHGVLFDVEFDGFWLDEWGPRPQALEEAKRLASAQIAVAPKLIPIFGHRMIADEPHAAGNPVFSVLQTDIIYYGFDLADYLRAEFHLPGRELWPERLRPIRFWSGIAT